MQRKYSKLYNVWISLCLVVLTAYALLSINWAVQIDVYADMVTIPNDGTAQEVPYGDSKLPKSYTDLDYYDCYIPYTLRLSDIGGWANRFISGLDAYNSTMSTRTQALYAGQKINKEWDEIAKGNTTYKGTTISMDSLNMNVYTDTNGNQYYACALPEFCYRFGGLNGGNSGFPGFSSANRGQFFDVILTDGTVIHFIVRDAKSSYHTNNPTSVRAPRGDEAVYGFAELVYPQYANLFQAQAGETLEVFCSSVTDFTSHYNITSGGNKIAIIRMYNATLDTDSAPTRADGVGTEVSYKLADSVHITSPDGAAAMGSSSLTTTGSSLVEEWELLGMPAYQDLSKDQMNINLPSLDDMSISDAANVITIGQYMSLMKEASLLDTLRVGITAVGIVVLLYGFFLLVAVIFDRSNNFIDISMVGILTFGHLKLNPVREKGVPQPSGYASTMRIVGVSVVVVIVGFAILSSSLTMLIGRIIYHLM